MEESETIPFVENNQSDSLHDKRSGSFARNRIIYDEEYIVLMQSKGEYLVWCVIGVK